MARPTMARRAGRVGLLCSLALILTGTALPARGAPDGPGSIAATVFNCPLGMTPETLDPAACALATELFGITLVSTEADLPARPLETAAFDGRSFRWDGLPVPKQYRLILSQPAGSPYTERLVVGEGVTRDQQSYLLSLSPERPDAEVTVYFFATRIVEDRPTFTQSILVTNCDGRAPIFITVAQPGCRTAEGVVITVTAADDGRLIGTCATQPPAAGSQTGFCAVDIPWGTKVVVTEDLTTLPPGYLPRQNPIPWQTPPKPPYGVVDGETGAPWFVNLRYPAATPESAPPREGRAAHIHGGRCDDLDRTPRYDLTDLAPVTGEPVGVVPAAPVETSSTVIDVALDFLLAEPHALQVHASHVATDATVACGDLGGVRDVAGGLTIALQARDGSGLNGVAYLLPDRAYPGRTRVWVVLAAVGLGAG